MSNPTVVKQFSIVLNNKLYEMNTGDLAELLITKAKFDRLTQHLKTNNALLWGELQPVLDPPDVS